MAIRILVWKWMSACLLVEVSFCYLYGLGKDILMSALSKLMFFHWTSAPILYAENTVLELRRFLNIFIQFFLSKLEVYLGIGKQPHRVFGFVTVLLPECHLLVPVERGNVVLESHGGRITESARNGCCLIFPTGL